MESAQIESDCQDRQKFTHAVNYSSPKPKNSLEVNRIRFRVSLRLYSCSLQIHAAHSLWLILVIIQEVTGLQPLPTTCQ